LYIIYLDSLWTNEYYLQWIELINYNY
jgi:hypothetical protein